MSRFRRDVLLCSAFGLLAWDLGVESLFGIGAAVLGVCFGIDAVIQGLKINDL